MPVPTSERAMTGRRPTRSERRGQRKSAPNWPNGYADESEPNEAPMLSPKCARSATLIGNVIVKPRRLRNVERSTVAIETALAGLNCVEDASGAGGGEGPSSAPPVADMRALLSLLTRSIGRTVGVATVGLGDEVQPVEGTATSAAIALANTTPSMSLVIF